MCKIAHWENITQQHVTLPNILCKIAQLGNITHQRWAVFEYICIQIRMCILLYLKPTVFGKIFYSLYVILLVIIFIFSLFLFGTARNTATEITITWFLTEIYIHVFYPIARKLNFHAINNENIIWIQNRWCNSIQCLRPEHSLIW